jgi:N-acetylmuramoyl-L-alanine amidase
MNPGPEPVSTFRTIVIADIVSKRPIHHAAVVFGDSLVANGSTSGTYFLPEASAESLDNWVVAWGYEPLFGDTTGGARPDTLFMTPWYEGRLLDRRFVIDPEGGFGLGPGMGQLGLSGPYVNQQVALYLAEYLRAAGAKVELTRRSEQTLSPRDVVALTNRFGADRYIEIRHRSALEDSGLTIETYFFPGSRTGRAMAEAVQTAAARSLGLESRAPRELVTFPLQQTACPAMVIEYPSISSMEEELRLGEPWYQRKQAYGAFVGLLTHYGVEDTTRLTLRIDTDSNRGNWLVTVDKTWNLLTDPGGSATFAGIPRDRAHLVELRRGNTRVSAPLPADGDQTAPDRPRVVILPIERSP